MSSYDALASSYDALTEDAQYRRRADYLERQFRRSRIPVRSVLDLACGTGTIACLLAERGYQVVAVDASEEMLTQAAHKAAFLQHFATLFLLFSVLNNADTRAEQRPNDLFQRTAEGKTAVGKGIKIGFSGQNDRHGSLLGCLEHFQFETRYVSNHTACRLAEKTRFYAHFGPGGAVPPPSRFTFFKVETL